MESRFVGNEDSNHLLSLDPLLERPPLRIDMTVLSQALAHKRLLITGAGGSIGVALSEWLCALHPAELCLLDNHEDSLFKLQQRLGMAGGNLSLGFVLADVRDRRRMRLVFEERQPDVVFHLAAYKHVHLAEENPGEAIAVNVLGTLNVIQQAIEAKVGKVVYPSTDKAVNAPSVYGATKRMAEILLQAYAKETDTQFSIVRLVNILGARGGVIETFLKQIRSGLPLTVTHPEMTRYWITMREALFLLAYAACVADSPTILLLDMGAPIEVRAMAQRLWKMLGLPDEECEVKYVGMRVGERLHEELINAGEQIVASDYPGILKIRNLQSDPRSMEELRREVAALRRWLNRGEGDKLKHKLFALLQAAPGACRW
ncbi:MAG: polysaccharide biosynthesis protein [Chloroflexi bacterium]|nr:polysaccharide biosynthesis protein [Chloroflexota bacterium]MCL5075393.1 polysaccharide biosynthesis protein [Chloroflexota bacterium]